MAGLSSNAKFDQFGFDSHTRDLERLWLLYDSVSTGVTSQATPGPTLELGADLTAIQGVQGAGYLYKIQPGAWELRASIPWGEITGAPTAWPLGGVLNGTTLTAGINASGVGAGSYGSASAVATFTVGDDGRLTAASSTSIQIAQSQVTNLVTDLAAKQPLDADLTAIAALTGTGIASRTASNTWATRSLTAPAAGLTITNPAGIAGNPTFALANDLAAVEGLASTGLIRRTGTDAWSAGTQVATGEIADLAVTNAKLASAAVSTDKIDTIDTVAANLILTYNAIGTRMSWRKVSTDMVNDGQITSAKLAPMSWAAFIGAIGSSPSINLATEVTGTLAVANGGTGTASPSWTIASNVADVTDTGALGFSGTHFSGTLTLYEKRPRYNAKWLKGYEVDTSGIVATGSLGAQLACFVNSTDMVGFGAQVGASANGAQGAIITAYTTGPTSFEIGEVAPVGAAETGYVLGIDTDLSVANAKPKWLRDIVLGKGQGAASATVGRLRVVMSTGGDYCDITSSKATFYRMVAGTARKVIDLDLTAISWVAGNYDANCIKPREFDVCDSTGAAKKQLFLASNPY